MSASSKPSNVVASVTSSDDHRIGQSATSVAKTRPGLGST